MLAGRTVDVAEQLFRFDLAGFNYGQGNRERFSSAVPERLLQDMRSSRAWNGTLALRPTEILTALATAARRRAA